MALIVPDSKVTDEVLWELLAQHLEGIRDVGEMIRDDSRPPKDRMRLAMAAAFADDVAATLEAATPPGSSRPVLERSVNASYAAMLLLIDYRKTFTEGPTVPRSSATTAPPPPP